MKPVYTAPELLKQFGITANPVTHDFGGLLRQLIDDKQYDLQAVVELCRGGYFGNFVQKMLLRHPVDSVSSIANYFGAQAAFLEKSKATASYVASPQQNRAIDGALAARGNVYSSIGASTPPFFGQGAAADMDFPGSPIPSSFASLPIAIIGGGVAGILVAHGLFLMGLRGYRIYEKTKNSYGIWSREDVFKRSRNNPRDVSFARLKLKAAPGSGEEVRAFLKAVTDNTSNNRSQVGVDKVTPGKNDKGANILKLTLNDATKTEAEFPIVVNCIGLGPPIDPTGQDDRMVCTVSQTEAGKRWQETLEVDQVKNKTFVFIGLGNSTAEMIRQLHVFQDKGVTCDYRILTHYPEESVLFPDDVVGTSDRHGEDIKYRVFRDISQPNLVDFQGDLPDNRYDYFRALKSGKIISDVTRWGIRKGSLYWTRKGSSIPNTGSVKHDHLYTLIGYRHAVDTFDEMRIPLRGADDHSARYHFDGEFCDYKGEPIKGYFGFGAILDAPENRNAIVIPGMVFRFGDLAFSILMRMAEYSLKTNGTL